MDAQQQGFKKRGVTATTLGIEHPRPPAYTPKRLFTLSESAHYLGRTVWSMRDLIWSGKLPIVRSGKKIYCDIKDLDEYINKYRTRYS